MRTLLVAALLLMTGCAHLYLAQSVPVHNVFRQVIVDAADVFKPLYEAAVAENAEKPTAEATKAQEPYDAIVYALRACQEAENVLHGALAQCMASSDETCDVSRTGFACAAAALDLLSLSYGQIRGGAPLYAAAAIAKAQLTELANGATCEASYASP